MSWQHVARQEGRKGAHFEDASAFLGEAEKWDRSVVIYIDSHLREGVRGEDIAKRISELGFKRVWMCTGRAAEEFRSQSFLSGVIGKHPPWGKLKG
jgi:hypothetical protein